MSILLALARVIDALSNGVGKLMWWLTAAMVLIGAYNVITRYLGQYLGMQLSANVYLELQTYAFDLIFLLGAAYVLRADAHVRVDIIYSRLGARARAAIDIFGTLVFLIPFCVFGLYFCYGYVERSWAVMEQSPNPGGLARYPIKTVILVAFGMLLLQGISEIIKNAALLTGHRRVDESGTAQAAERADAL
ncbi:C4-dicarboxylate ABC transporter substrate-binding protein [Salinisphaera orenii MK-B5]|uniref:TRAP transporter small permease protein n=1 Tax=Salinisphaera orenii MK-B5 TaxID=856730 RepID=A0A423PM22_9GAMM|nr:TRAP transporter small permease subunit [Salinisphaera orenii]ROO26666.1 C4-dicarboxylate ABC transporter substrate-binding protein [Salinisphaera orenii MK-B5]